MMMCNIKHANKMAGKFFFEPDTLRFFRSRVSDQVYEGPGGVYFVTSEQNHGFGGIYSRLYTVRMFDRATGDCETAPGTKFQQYESRSGAHACAARLARTPPAPVAAPPEVQASV